MNRNNKKISILLLLVMVVQIFTPFLNIIGYATKDTVIDEIVLEEAGKKNGKPAYNLKAKWSIDDKSKKKGDYFEFKLPDDLEMNTFQNILYLNSPDGKVYAEGKIEGNTITFTFTELVEDEINIHGSFYINGLTTKKGTGNDGIKEKDVEIKEDNKTIWKGSVEIDTGGEIIGQEPHPPYTTYNLRKNPEKGSSYYTYEPELKQDGYIYLTWQLDLNTAREKYKGNVLIIDTLGENQEFVPDSFILEVFDDMNSKFAKSDQFYKIEGINEYEEVKNMEISQDGKSFELNMDLKGEKGYLLQYESRISKKDFLESYLEGKRYHENHIFMEYEGEEVESSTGEYDLNDMGQNQIGELPREGTGKLNLIKLDKEKNKLEGSQFTIEKIDTQGNTLGYVSIDNDGNVKFNEYENDKNKDPRPLEIPKEGLEIENFPSGAYKITEIEAPKGYLKLKEPIVKIIDFQTINFIKEYNIEYLKQNHYYISQNINYILGSAIAGNPENTEEIIKEFLKSQGYDFEEEAIVIEIENKENKKDLEIVKNWKNIEEYKGDKETLKAKFQIFAYKLVDGKPTVLKEDELKNFIGTSEQPKVYELIYGKESLIVEDLPYEDENGNEYVYTIEELDLPDFDKEDDKVIKLSEYVDEDDVKVEFTNTYNPTEPEEPKPEDPKGSLKIKKVDSEDLKGLQGVKFALKNNELGYEESLESNGEGSLEFKDLKPGKYTLKEIETLNGYESLDVEIEVEIDEKGKTEIVKTENDLIEFKEDTLIVKNAKEKPVEDPKGSLKIKKVDSKDETKVLEGVKFAIKDEEGKIVSEDITTSDGLLEFKDLEPGKYTLKEIETLNGYESLDVEIEVEIDEKGKTKIDKIETNLIEYKGDILTVKNAKEKPVEDPKGSLKIKKVDSEDLKGLQGVKFAIKDEEGKIVSEDITTSDGSLEFKDLEPGKYTLKEIETLNGYESLDAEIEVEIDEKGKTKIDKIETNLIEYKGDILTVKNVKEEPIEKPKSGFKLKKVDSKDKTGLTGAVFNLYEIIKEEAIVEKEVETELEDDLEIEEPEEIENEDTIEDESEKVDEIKDEVEDTDEDEKEIIVEYKNEFVKKVITDNQGFVSLDDLEPGEYILKEIKAPEGYKLEEKEIKIVITEDENGNYNYKIAEVDGVRFDSETETIEVDNVKTPTEPDKPEPEEPTDPDTPKPEKPTKPNRPPKPEEPIKPVDPDKPEPEKPEEEVDEDIKGDIVIDEDEKEIETEENKVEEDIKEEIRDDILILEDSIENSLEKQNIKYLPKTGDGLNKKTYGIFTLILGSFLILLGIKREKNED